MAKYTKTIQEILHNQWIGYPAALVAVALVSLIIGGVEGIYHIANISMLYLIAVLVTATAFGSGPAVLASIAAFLAFDWFFVQPLYTLNVADPDEWIVLLLFLLTAIITGQLAAGQRHRAQEAKEREREAVVLYDVVRLMSRYDVEGALKAVADRLCRELQLGGVVIEVTDDTGAMVSKATAGDPEAIALADSMGPVSGPRTGRGSISSVTQVSGPGRWIRIVPPGRPRTERGPQGYQLLTIPVLVQDRRKGTLLLVRAPNGPVITVADDRLLLAAAAQLGVAMERDQLRREATEAEILRRTDELKTALLNAVSHDLRTPLASIITSAGSLRQTDVVWNQEERLEFAEAIEEEAQRLNRIVGNLLDLSRMEAGSLRPEKSWYDLGSLVDDVVGRLRLMVAGHRLVIDIPEELPPVLLDCVQIDQVLSNLIENATKYAPPGTEIRIAARQTASEIQVEVLDQGPGVPAASIPQLFEPFYRVDQSYARAKGTGLGLAVAKGLVEAHGGRIWVENRKGGGARFVFTLPTGSSSPVEAAAGKGDA